MFSVSPSNICYYSLSFLIIVFTHKFSYSPYSLSPFTNLQVKAWILFLSQYMLHILLYTSWIVCFLCIFDSWIWVFDFWWIWCVLLVFMWWLSLLCMYNVLFETHTHTLSWFRPNSHEFRALFQFSDLGPPYANKACCLV